METTINNAEPPDQQIKIPFWNMSQTHRCVLPGYIIVLTVLILTVVRACDQSITHDEAFCYNNFIAIGCKHIWTSFHSNNHTLFSLLSCITTSLFGLSPFTLRIPTLLGGLMYLLAAERICRIATSNIRSYIVTLLALTANPFILDYLVIARGYGLALGFFMTALALCSSELLETGRKNPSSCPSSREHTDNKNYRKLKYTAISCLCALSTAANLGFAFVNAGLLIIFCAWIYFNEHPHQTRVMKQYVFDGRFLCLVIPGLLLFAVINPAIAAYDRDTMYFGSDTWHEAYMTITAALFDDFPATNAVTCSWIIEIVRWTPLFFGIIVLASAVLTFIPRATCYGARFCTMDNRSILWWFVLFILCMTTCFHGIAHIFFDVPLPRERTGIFLIPLVILLISISIDGYDIDAFQKTIKTAGRAMSLLIVLYFISCLRITHFRAWKYDSGSRQVFETVYSLNNDYTSSDIGINWALEPGLNFYRKIFRNKPVPVFTRNKPTEKQSLFVLRPKDSQADNELIRDHSLKVLFEHELSGVIVAVRK